MSLNFLCFIYRFNEEPSNSSFRIVGVHDQMRPWTATQLAANGLITQKFQTRSSMEASIEAIAKKLQVSSYSLLSVSEYNSLLEESHQLEDFRKKLQSRENSLLDQKILQKESEETPMVRSKESQGFFSRIFGQDNT